MAGSVSPPELVVILGFRTVAAKPHILTHLVLFFLAVQSVSAQQGIVRKNLLISGDTTVIDTVHILPGTFHCNIPKDQYVVDYMNALFIRKSEQLTGSYRCTYRRVPSVLTETYYHNDTSHVNSGKLPGKDPFKLTIDENPNANFFGTGLNKTGSISRGISFGNNQNLSVNSNLNLQMSGKIAPDVSILASVTDDNIPIQPEGNTQQLQEFDQVYIKIFQEKKWDLIAGDFWLEKPIGYFMTYKKRAQGGSFGARVPLNPGRDKPNTWDVQASGAISKGKFSRNVIQGVEGNQGPYKLVGADNEPFIIVLSGTERVYIDGKLLVRGQDNDYIIDYNTAEVTFTARNLITKDRRIIVEFQYSDKNYARSLFQVANTFSVKKWKVWLNAYSEQDSKNQPLQIELSEEQKLSLALAGDDISQAFTNSVDTANFTDNRILYYLKDTTVGLVTYADILVYTTEQDCTLYKATFSNVGAGNGNYELQEITGVGRIYQWVAPSGTGEPQGSFEPVIQLVPPNQQQMVTAGAEWTMDRGKLGVEAAYSNYDRNTFSNLDGADDQGYALNGYWDGKRDIGKKAAQLVGAARVEFVNTDFQRIERFRAVEFTRNWNLTGLNLTGDQFMASASAAYVQKALGQVRYQYNMFQSAAEFQGIKNDLNVNLKRDRWGASVNGSYLIANGQTSSNFLRHKSHLYADFKKLRLSYNDEHELNTVAGSSTLSSYQFYDYQVSLGNSDSAKSRYSVYFRQRIEQRPDSSDVLGRASLANHYGAQWQSPTGKANRFNVNVAYRELTVVDTNRINVQPENTLVGRIEHGLRLWRGAVTTSTYYEIGSGLELKREFLYLEVQPGQGVYTWIDYDEDGVKDLNEFEIAQFSDQASYIRVFTPTNEYVKTFTNQFNQSIFLKPSMVWRRKDGIRKLLSRFSDQLIYRVDRKTNAIQADELYNPFVTAIADTALISTTSSLRNTFYFNRTSQKFGMDYSFQNTTGKTLLTSGFDSRFQQFHEARIRWNVTRLITIRADGELGRKRNSADYISGRNYDLDYHEERIEFSVQPNIQSRISVEGIYSEKHNAPGEGGEYARILNAGVEARYNVVNKGSFTAKFNFIHNTYTGQENTTLAYEMLDALRTGQNFTWNVLYQRAINKNLQLNVSYSGRKSPENRAIHTGGVQVRALF